MTGFESVSRQQVEKTFAEATLTYIAGTADDPVLSAQLSQRREIWRWLIWGMFAVIAVEFILATLRSAGGDEAGGGRWPSLRAWQPKRPSPEGKIHRVTGRNEPLSKV